jgi:hypothetical protein
MGTALMATKKNRTQKELNPAEPKFYGAFQVMFPASFMFVNCKQNPCGSSLGKKVKSEKKELSLVFCTQE